MLSIISSILIDSESFKGLLMGFGTGLTLVGVFNIIVMYVKKKKDEQYEDDMNLEFTDERLILNKFKVLGYSGTIGIFVLALSNVAHLIFETNLLISNIVVIIGYTFLIAGFKLFYRNR